MNNSTLFKQAHVMTKQVIKQGDDYKTTFGLCLKAIKEKQTSQQTSNINFIVLAILVLSITKVVSVLKDSAEPAALILGILFNPFSLLIYNGLYLSIVGG